MQGLSAFKVGEQGRILRLLPHNPIYRQKLLAMGLLPGTTFKVNRLAPLGDPIEIWVRGYGLSLRKFEAAILEVEKLC